jgi:uncharacterized membrane protein YgdD (TMEM256/DUF423 family)
MPKARHAPSGLFAILSTTALAVGAFAIVTPQTWRLSPPVSAIPTSAPLIVLSAILLLMASLSTFGKSSRRYRWWTGVALIGLMLWAFGQATVLSAFLAAARPVSGALMLIAISVLTVKSARAIFKS